MRKFRDSSKNFDYLTEIVTLSFTLLSIVLSLIWFRHYNDIMFLHLYIYEILINLIHFNFSQFLESINFIFILKKIFKK